MPHKWQLHVCAPCTQAWCSGNTSCWLCLWHSKKKFILIQKTFDR